MPSTRGKGGTPGSSGSGGFPALEAGSGAAGLLSGVGGSLLKGFGIKSLAGLAVPGIGPVLGLLGAVGIKIPILDGLIDGLIGSLVKTKEPDLPDGFVWGDAIRYTGEDGPSYAGQVVFSEEYDWPVGNWSYARQEIMPLAGITREGYLLFVEHKGDTHGMTGKFTGEEYDGKNAVELNAQADRFVIEAAEMGIPGGVEGRKLPALLIVVAVILLFVMVGRKK